MREKYKEIMDQVKVSDTARSEILKNVLLANDTEVRKPLPSGARHRWQRGLIAAICAGTAAAACLLAVPAMNSTVRYHRLGSGKAMVEATPSADSPPAMQSAAVAAPAETSASGLIVPLPEETVPEDHSAPALTEKPPAQTLGNHAAVSSPGSFQGQRPAEPLPAQTASTVGGVGPAAGTEGGDIPDTGPASSEAAGISPGGEELPPDPPLFTTGGPLPSQGATYIPETAPEPGCSEGAVEAAPPLPKPEPPAASSQPTPTAVSVSSPEVGPAPAATECPSDDPEETASQPEQSPSAEPSSAPSE